MKATFVFFITAALFSSGIMTAQTQNQSVKIEFNIDQELLANLHFSPEDLTGLLHRLKDLEAAFGVSNDTPCYQHRDVVHVTPEASASTTSGIEFMGEIYPPMPSEDTGRVALPTTKVKDSLPAGYFIFMGDAYPPLPEEKVSFGFTM